MSRGGAHGVAWAGVALALLGAGGWWLVARPAAAPPAAAAPGEAALREAVRALQAAPGAGEQGSDEPSLRLAARVRALWSAHLRQAGPELVAFAEPAPACWVRRDPAGDVVLVAPAELGGTPLAQRERLLGALWAVASAAAAEGDGGAAGRPLGVGLRAPLTFTGVAVGRAGEPAPAEAKVALAVIPSALYPLLGG